MWGKVDGMCRKWGERGWLISWSGEMGQGVRQVEIGLERLKDCPTDEADR